MDQTACEKKTIAEKISHTPHSYCINHMYWDRQAWANSADLDETLQNVASHQGLHCHSSNNFYAQSFEERWKGHIVLPMSVSPRPVLAICIQVFQAGAPVSFGHISSYTQHRVLNCTCSNCSRPRWLSWMRRPTGDQEVAGSTPAEVGNILSWRLIMKYFLRSFSPFRWFKKGSCQFLAKECAQYWLTA